MCCVAFIVKYVLFFTNVVFSLAGIALIALGIVVLVQATEILALIPVNLNLIPISIIVLGSIIFLIAFCGCCGAIRESRCLLITYSVCMLVLAAAKIWLTVFIFQSLNTIYGTVEGWFRDAFDNPNLSGAFNLVEVAFRCCGVDGPGSYVDVSLPSACCANPTTSDVTGTCAPEDSFGGCANIVADWFEVFGDTIGAVLITIIVVELVAMIFGLFLSNTITNRKKGFA